MHWYLDVLKNHYMDFNGRASRKEYWMYTLVVAILSVILVILVNISEVFYLLYTIFILINIIPTWALSVRRLHDIGKTGWWLLVNLIPVIGSIILFVFTCIGSQPGANQYGKNPYGN